MLDSITKSNPFKLAQTAHTLSGNILDQSADPYSFLSNQRQNPAVGSSRQDHLLSLPVQSSIREMTLLNHPMVESQDVLPTTMTKTEVDPLVGIANGDPLVTQAIANSPRIQQTVYESLDWSDEFNPTRYNCFKDDYLLQSPVTTQLALGMASFAFDAYLQILDGITGAILAFDDDNGLGTDSQITFTALAGRPYVIRATSFSEFAMGAYTLSENVLNSNPVPGSFDSTYGYGLVDAAAAVAVSINAFPFAPVSDVYYSWSNNMVNAPEVWARGYTGSNVVVAVVDSGVDYQHYDLNDNIWYNPREIAGNGIDDDGNGYPDDILGWDFVQFDNDPMDVEGHGTHVAGTIASEANYWGTTGVAYNARIMPVRVLGDDGSGTNNGVARGIYYAADNGANVINLSLGGGYSSEIESAIQYASSRGAIVVMSAGNDGMSEPGYPGHHATQWGLVVGAVDSYVTIADFSNRAGYDSQMQYVVAPGVEIESTVPGDYYDFMNGTSMAAPHVAGVVALMLSANPYLTDVQVRDIITGTAVPLINGWSSSDQVEQSNLDVNDNPLFLARPPAALATSLKGNYGKRAGQRLNSWKTAQASFDRTSSGALRDPLSGQLLGVMQ